MGSFIYYRRPGTAGGARGQQLALPLNDHLGPPTSYNDLDGALGCY